MRPRIVLQRWMFWALLGAASVAVHAPMTAVAQAPASPSDDMSTEDMVRDASSMVAQMLESQSAVERALEDEINASEDAQRVEYIQQRLTAIQGFVRVAEEALASLTSDTSGDRREAVHHWNLVYVSSERVRVLVMQVEQYSGAISRYTGDTERTPNIDSRIPDLITWLMDEFSMFDDPLLGAVLSEASVQR
jgi:hypothetical protein